MDQLILNNEEKFLQGKLEGYSLEEAENKFDTEGKPLYFPGCTIICKILENSDLFDELSLMQSKYKDFNPNNAYTYIPPSSFPWLHLFGNVLMKVFINSIFIVF